MVAGILDVDDIKATGVLLSRLDNTNTTNVFTSNDHALVSRLEFDELEDLSALQIKLDGVVDIDGGIRVAEGAAVVRNNEGDSLGTNGALLDLQKLELNFSKKNMECQKWK